MVTTLGRRFVWVVLFFSLALNLSLIVGALYAGQRVDAPPRGDRMIARLSAALSLTDAQRAELAAIRTSVVDRYLARDRQGKDWGSILAGVLRQPTFDGGALKLSLTERDAGRIDFFISIMSRLYNFTQGLAPEARQSFLAQIEKDDSFLRRLFGPDQVARRG